MAGKRKDVLQETPAGIARNTGREELHEWLVRHDHDEFADARRKGVPHGVQPNRNAGLALQISFWRGMEGAHRSRTMSVRAASLPKFFMPSGQTRKAVWPKAQNGRRSRIVSPQ